MTDSHNSISLLRCLSLWNSVFGPQIQHFDPGPLQPQSPFYKLPIELRTQIYEEVLDLRRHPRETLVLPLTFRGIGECFVKRLSPSCFANHRTLYESVRTYMSKVQFLIATFEDSPTQLHQFLSKFPLQAGTSTGFNCITALRVEDSLQDRLQDTSTLITSCLALRELTFIIHEHQLTVFDLEPVDSYRLKTANELQRCFSPQITAFSAAHRLQKINVLCSRRILIPDVTRKIKDKVSERFDIFMQVLREDLPLVEIKKGVR